MKGTEEPETTPAKPQDVANLYSRVDLDGVYHTFSATREEARARLRERTRAVVEAPSEAIAAEPAAEAVADAIAEAVAETGAFLEPPPQIEAEAWPGELLAEPSVEPPVKLPPAEDAPRPAVRPGPSLYVIGEAAALTTQQAAEAQAVGDRRSADRRSQRGESEVARWLALKDMQRAAEEGRVARRAQPPVLAMFSLAGGVGKTSLMASLGSMLANRGERVLLMDMSKYGLLSLYFGARDLRTEGLRSFSRNDGGVPVTVMNVDAAAAGDERSRRDWFAEATAEAGDGLQRVLIDLPTGMENLLSRLDATTATVVVPVEPNLTSVLSLQRIAAFFRGRRESTLQPYFLLNKFDPLVALHTEVREMLRQQWGDRVLPFAMRRSRAVTEALTEGMTTVDYAPHAPIVEDFAQFASWTRSIAEPAIVSVPGVRWSER